MVFFIKLAWRNIFRNKRRTFIAGVAIAVGLASLIFCDALTRGMKDNLIKSATASFLGEGQIHARGFRETQDAEKTVNNLPAVMDGLRSEKTVELFTLRTMSLGMISSPANVSAVIPSRSMPVITSLSPSAIPNLAAMARAVAGWSPVIISGMMPALRHSATAL